LPDLALLAVLAALWVLRGRSRTPLAGLLVFLGGLFPLLGFFNIYAFVFSFVADHWQYLALLGLIAAVAAGWSAALAAARRWQRALLYGLALAGVGTCGVLTRRECRNYRDPENFYHTILARNSAAWMPHNNLGAAFFLAGKLPEARDEFAAAVRLKPDYADGHYNLGKTLWSLRAYAPAQAEMAEALRLNPSDARAADYLGQCLAATGHWPEAIAAFARARQLGGDNHLLRYNLAVAENNLGTLLGNRGQFSEALPHFELAVAWNPTYVQAHENLARALIALGRAEAGAAEFRAAARLQATGRN